MWWLQGLKLNEHYVDSNVKTNRMRSESDMDWFAVVRMKFVQK